MFAEPGSVVFDFDEVEDVGACRLVALPDGRADLGLQQAEEALGCGVGVIRRLLVNPILESEVGCG